MIFYFQLNNIGGEDNRIFGYKYQEISLFLLNIEVVPEHDH